MSTPEQLLIDASADIFARARAEAVAFGRSLTPAQAAAPVGSCPGWTVTDVFAHVTGIVDDIIALRLDGLGSDAWTAAQVDARRGRSLAEVCDEYEELGERFDAFAVAHPEVGAAGTMPLPMRLTADLTIHLGDVATSLGLAPDRDSPALRLTLARYGPAFIDRAAAAGLPPVRVEETGPEEPLAFGPTGVDTVTVAGSTYDLVRSLAGRRSRAQITGLLQWSIDGRAHAPLFSSYGLPTEDGA